MARLSHFIFYSAWINEIPIASETGTLGRLIKGLNIQTYYTLAI